MGRALYRETVREFLQDSPGQTAIGAKKLGFLLPQDKRVVAALAAALNRPGVESSDDSQVVRTALSEILRAHPDLAEGPLTGKFDRNISPAAAVALNDSGPLAAGANRLVFP